MTEMFFDVVNVSVAKKLTFLKLGEQVSVFIFFPLKKPL